MNDIEAFIERIKGTVDTLINLIGELEQQRDNEINELSKRISRLEHELVRVMQK